MAPMAQRRQRGGRLDGQRRRPGRALGRPQLLYNYFKQLFAQVTNPPVDCIREEIIMSMETTIGREHNLLEPTPQSARQIKLQVADPDERRAGQAAPARRHDARRGFKSVTLPILFTGQGRARAGLEQAHGRAVPRRPAQAIADGQRHSSSCPTAASTREHAPIPALLAVAGVHHHLIREGTRTQVGLVLESGEPREVHHFALLIGYGAGAINPYLAFETLDDMIRQGHADRASTHAKAVKNYVKAINKGVLKVMSKMGISTAQSYCGAQIFEAIGLEPGRHRQVLHLDGVARRRHRPRRDRRGGRRRATTAPSPTGRSTATRSTSAASTSTASDGEYHLFNPETVHKLQHACRTDNYKVFKEYSEARQRPVEAALHPARPVRAQARRRSRSPSRRSSRSRRS